MHDANSARPGLIRQGDVLLVPVTSVPEDTTPVPREDGRVILAHGEVTGHAHAITEDSVTLVTSEEAEDLRTWLLVETEEPVILKHEEHDHLPIPPGAYEVRRQREYTPEAIRFVAD